MHNLIPNELYKFILNKNLTNSILAWKINYKKIIDDSDAISIHCLYNKSILLYIGKMLITSKNRNNLIETHVFLDKKDFIIFDINERNQPNYKLVKIT